MKKDLEVSRSFVKQTYDFLLDTLWRRPPLVQDINEETKTHARMLEWKQMTRKTFFRGGMATSICNSFLIMLVERNKDNFKINVIGTGVLLLTL